MITKKYSDFFKGLEKNNNRDWFHENKKSYEKEVKKPFLDLLEVLLPDLMDLNSDISPNPKDALFRINRDIRFSKDKTPYNTVMKAGFSAGGKKSFLPGYYLGISAEKIHVGGGLFNLKGPELKLVRNLVLEDTDEFMSIVNGKSFSGMFGELLGERAKRLDVKYQPLLEQTPYIANKQFYAMTDLALADHYDSKDLPKTILKYFKEIHSLNTFLQRAF
ncbi:MAG: DUF2461 domain-containing protein [Cyclobacteriaceae bacterium]